VILGRFPGCKFGVEITNTGVEIGNAVQTRAQKLKDEKPFRPLLTAKVPQLDVTHDQIRKLQQDDCSLTKCFDRVGLTLPTDDSPREVFVLRNNLLYRAVVVKNKDPVWQLVVPNSLRESVLIAAHDGLFGGHMASNSTFKRISLFFF
jgi:hypothetical protein